MLHTAECRQSVSESAGTSWTPPSRSGATTKYLRPFFTVATSALTQPDSLATRTSGVLRSVFLILTGPTGLVSPPSSQVVIRNLIAPPFVYDTAYRMIAPTTRPPST